jgi:AcrR family transcriptional regulator
MNTMSSQKRKYELKARARSQEETRRRIAAATAELHQEVGPARATVSEIARRAGVTRVTVYNQFPDDRDLHRACQAHFLGEHPPPPLDAAMASPDPATRLRKVLELFYGWYAETEAMTANVERDRGAVPPLDEVMRESADAIRAALARDLAAGFGARGGRAGRVRALIALALDFWTWRRLAAEGLNPGAAAKLMASTVDV